MPDHRHPARAEPVQRGADAAGLSRDAVPADGARRLPVAEQVDTDDTVRTRQDPDHRVPPGHRGRGAVNQQQAWRTRPAVLHHVHVTIVKRHEPVTSARIAGHMLRHSGISCHLL